MKHIIEDVIRDLARACIDQKKGFEFMDWVYRHFEEKGWREKCRKIFREQLMKEG